MITKNLYKECIGAITKLMDSEEKLYSMTGGAIDTGNWLELQEAIGKFIELLEYCTKDSDKNSNLSYFLWELDCGRNWKHGSITDEQGRDIKCETIDDLWNNFIVADHPEVVDHGSDETESD